jgi:hypothetical protein
MTIGVVLKQIAVQRGILVVQKPVQETLHF